MVSLNRVNDLERKAEGTEMNNNTKAHLKVFGLVYLIVLLAAFTLFGVLRWFVQFNYFLVTGIILLAAIPVSFVIYFLLLNKEKRNPVSKLHTDFAKELLEHGFTEKFFQMSDEGINAYKSGIDKSPVYVRDFVLFRHDYYVLNGQYETALSYISILDEKNYTGQDIVFMDNGMSALLYYSALMDVYRGLNDRENAIKLIERAKPFLEKEHKKDTIALGAQIIYYNYYMTISNYDLARESLEKIKAFSSEESKSLITRYYCEAEFYLHEGRKQEAISALRNVETYIKKFPVMYGYYYQKYQERLGLTEDMK